MKHTRLLEIIREEIAGALKEASTTYAGPSSIDDLKKDKSYSGLTGDAKKDSEEKLKSGGTVTIGEEKRKKLAEKYQLDEETINEMASVIQTKKALSKLVDAGLSPKENLDLVIDVEKETLDQFKNSNPSMTSDGRLIRKLKPEEITGKKDTKGYGADFEQNFKKKSGVRFDEFTADIEDKFNKAFPDEKKFNSGLATNTTEKDAAAQIFNLEKGKQGRKVDPNKTEKPASTGKKGIPASEPKTEKSATLTKGDDGFDTVEYSDDEGSAEAAKAAGSDETAKKLGNISTRKDKIVKAYQELQPQVKDKIDQAKAGDKESTNWLKDKWTPILKAYNKAKEVKI